MPNGGKVWPTIDPLLDLPGGTDGEREGIRRGKVSGIGHLKNTMGGLVLLSGDERLRSQHAVDWFIMSCMSSNHEVVGYV